MSIFNMNSIFEEVSQKKMHDCDFENQKKRSIFEFDDEVEMMDEDEIFEEEDWDEEVDCEEDYCCDEDDDESSIFESSKVQHSIFQQSNNDIFKPESTKNNSKIFIAACADTKLDSETLEKLIKDQEVDNTVDAIKAILELLK